MTLKKYSLNLQIFVILAALCASSFAQQLATKEPIQIVKYINEGVGPEGSYQWGWVRIFYNLIEKSPPNRTISVMKPPTASLLKNKDNSKMLAQKTKLSKFKVQWNGLIKMETQSNSLTSLTKMDSNLKEAICQHLHQFQQPSKGLWNILPHILSKKKTKGNINRSVLCVNNFRL